MGTSSASENPTTACSSADTWNSWTITTSAGSDYIWHYWTKKIDNGNGSLEIESPTDSNVDIWEVWATTISANSSCIWHYWIGETGNKDYSPEIESPSPEEIERERREQEKWKIENERLEKEKQKAKRRAERLLFELIGKSDYRKFCKSGYVDVEGKSGKIYRIEPRHQIKVFDGKDKLDVAIESLCILTPNCHLPEADEIIWKKLLVEADEKELLRIANHF